MGLINTYDITLAESQCDRGNPDGLGAQYCEETCDDVLGQFCPNANEYQSCNTQGCPGRNSLKSLYELLITVYNDNFRFFQLTVHGVHGVHGTLALQPVVGDINGETELLLRKH